MPPWLRQDVRPARRGAQRRAGILRRGLLAVLALLALQWFLAGSSLDGQSDMPTRVLVLTAHPDDEVMFFAPAILALVKMGVEVHALCMSVGNAEGKGAIRRNELRQSYKLLGVPDARVQAIDDYALQDGMDVLWDSARIEKHVKIYEDATGPFEWILTFDRGGVSGHANHAACFEAAQSYIGNIAHGQAKRVFALRTIPVTYKFLSLPLALARHAWLGNIKADTTTSTKTLLFLSSPAEYANTLGAMVQHQSQLVWFRFLYVVFSTYMYGSQLVEVGAQGS